MVALKKLNNKKESHSKSKALSHSELNMKEYFKSQELNTEQIKFLFKLRSRMLSFRANFKEHYLKNQNKERALLCPLCQKHEDSQQNLIDCEEIDNSSEKITKK